MFLFISSAPPVLAAAGNLDPTFGGDGKVTSSTVPGFARAVAIQANGKIVAVGQTTFGSPHSKFELARYTTDGSLDTSFGGDGKVVTSFSGEADVALGAAIQTDGKMVAAGGSDIFTSRGRFALARYNTDGSLDSSFGDDGRVTTNFTSQTDLAHGMGIQADGKIVAVGHACLTAKCGRDRSALVRYNTDGSLDTSFGGDGKVSTNIIPRGDEQFVGVAFQADGKIVAVGSALVRYNTDGSLDTSFGDDGIVRRSGGEGSVAIQADGKIVTAGATGSFGSDSEFELTRYNTDGSLDTSFGGDGEVTTNFTPQFNGADFVSIQADGKIVAAGFSLGVSPCCVGRFELARYNTDGSLDTSFGGDGKVTTNFTAKGDFAYALAIQADGNIVAAGTAAFPSRHNRFALARYLA